VKKGDLKRVERGKYTAHSDPLIYATHVEKPSYISLWSGLRFYDLTPQQPTKVQVVSSSNRNNLEDIEFYYSRDIFGFEKRNYRGLEITVAEKEKLLIDILSYGKVPVSELEELVKIIDVNKTVKYCEKLGKSSVKKRTGFLIDKILGKKVKELKIDDRNYPSLDLTNPEEGKKNSEWRLKVNTDAFR
jgi:predicted transcriptional regulator of viral defense system